MTEVPSDLKYTHSHEWVRPEGDDVFTVGVTEHAQELLGDMVFVDLPEIDSSLALGDDCAVAESVKAASDVYAPISGVVIKINEDLEDSPEMINKDPYGDGWLFQIKGKETSEFEGLLDADEYKKIIEQDD